MRLLFLLLFFTFSLTNSQATTRYVKPTASGTGNGSSWANASASLQAMLNASSSGDDVWVAAGTYYPTEDKNGNSNPTDPRTKTFHLKSGVNIYGGFAGNETTLSARSITTNSTILSGDIGTLNLKSDNSYNVVYIYVSGSNTTGCIIDGFVIEEGNSNTSSHGNGGGIYCYGGTGTVFSHLHIKNNHALYNGGGVYVEAGEYTIKFDSIYSNSSSLHGGGMFIHGKSIIDSNAIYANSAIKYGGGAYILSKTILNGNSIYKNSTLRVYDVSVGGGVYFSAPDSNKITNNTIYSNNTSLTYDATIGGGLYLAGDTTTVYLVANNQMFHNHSHDAGGAVYVQKIRHCNFVNNTFYKNEITRIAATVKYGGAVYDNNASSHYTNNIFWKNIRGYFKDPDDINFYTFDTSHFKNNIFQLTNYTPGNLFAKDPLFTNESKPLGNDSIPGTADDGLMLKICSPAVNSGSVSNYSAKDILGNNRIAGHDIGAFEYPGTGPVKASPISGDDIICVGYNSTYTNTANGGTWTSSDTSIGKISQAGVVTAIDTGYFTITYTTDTTSCPGTTVTKKVLVTVYTPLGAIAGADSVCTASTIQLSNAVSRGVWTSSDTSIAVVNNAGLVTGIDTGVITITYRVGGVGCSTKVFKTITVGQTPAVNPITGSNLSICMLDTIQYSNTTSGGIWSTASMGAVSTISSTGVLTSQNGGYDQINYTVTNAFGCKNVASKPLYVVKPSPYYAITGPDSICNNDTTLFYHRIHVGTWLSSDTTIATITNIGYGRGLIEGKSPGVATISYKQSSFCAPIAYKTITILPTPTSGNITGNNLVCIYDSLQLSNSISNGIWSTTSMGNISSVDTTGLVTPAGAGTDTIRYIITNPNGCSDTSSLPIDIIASPTVSSISGTDSLCIGQATQLASLTPDGKWSSSDTTTLSVDTNGYVTATKDGIATINYTVTNAAGCTTTVSMDMYVAPIINVDIITGKTALCLHDTIQYSNNTLNGIWSTASNGSVCEITPQGLTLAKSNGIDTIIYTTANILGCTYTAQLPVTVNKPIKTNISGASTICAGYEDQYTHPTTNGSWTNINSSTGSINNAGIYSSLLSGNDTIQYKYVSNNCPITVELPLVINETPDTASITGDIDLCIGYNTFLNSSISGGTWSSSNNRYATISKDGQLSGINEGNARISYTITNDKGCFSIATHNVASHELITSSEKDGITILAGSNKEEATYQWVKCDNDFEIMSNHNKKSFTPTTPGLYAAIISYKSCVDTSQCYMINFLKDSDKTNTVVMWPNPANSYIRVTTIENIAKDIRLVDVSGNVIMTIKPNDHETKINVDYLSSGLYLVHVVFNDEEIVLKLTVL